MRKPKHGGKREGAGRPKKEPTQTLSYRVPKSKAKAIDQAIRKVIAREIKIIYEIKIQ